MSNPAQATYDTVKSLKQRWFIREAYPLYAVIGAGCLAASFMLTRTFFYNPDTKYIKKYRKEELSDDPREVQRGDSFYDHGIRRFLKGRHAGIFPNERFTKPRDNDE